MKSYLCSKTKQNKNTNNKNTKRTNLEEMELYLLLKTMTSRKKGVRNYLCLMAMFLMFLILTREGPCISLYTVRNVLSFRHVRTFPLPRD